MDIWFSLFVTLVGLIVAVGLSLVMVGYINLMPSSMAVERVWRIWVAGVPMAIVFIPVAVVCIISPFVNVMPWENVARWLSIPAVTIHLIALGGFMKAHWDEQAKVGKQFAIGLLLVAIAAGLLYGFGPTFAERIIASIKPA